MKQIVVFDVCDTLYNTNTTFKFLDKIFINNKKYKIFRKISKLFPVMLLNYLFYKLIKIDFIRAFGTFFLKGEKVQEIKKISNNFVYQDLVLEIKTIISKKIEFYKNKGYQIVLMSGSYDFIIKEVAEYFNVDEFYASKLCILNGEYTGKYDKDILMNKHDLFKENYTNLDQLVVISNNKTDLDFMNSADQAFAVCNKEKDFKFWKSHHKIECIKDY